MSMAQRCVQRQRGLAYPSDSADGESALAGLPEPSGECQQLLPPAHEARDAVHRQRVVVRRGVQDDIGRSSRRLLRGKTQCAVADQLDVGRALRRFAQPRQVAGGQLRQQLPAEFGQAFAGCLTRCQTAIQPLRQELGFDVIDGLARRDNRPDACALEEAARDVQRLTRVED